jgi:hypothetical protein
MTRRWPSGRSTRRGTSGTARSSSGGGTPYGSCRPRAHVIYGVYDIIARVEAETVQKVKDVILFKIRRIENVRSVLTLICV